ncbi:hypothetical protein KC19_1G025800 [Ceratodon purpureus]|uniref:Methyltransferase-like protein 23 n=1 Tax=Ceratodon purpureus TaxID=3225 RepID=A0A8T0J1P2_CERPU|nr:hypothetical protein KC19_1G025800 [Ceratodon purpureus]
MAEKMTKRAKRRDREDGLMRTVSQHHFQHAGSSQLLTISCSEVMQEEYGLYVWPCSIVLAEYVWQNRLRFAGARVVELGAGTALPGIVAAKVGAIVVLTDREDQPQVFENMQKTCDLNQVSCEMQGLTWGQWNEKSFALRHPAQIVLGADVLYASKDFDDLLATVKFLLQGMPDSVFITTYQPRSGHRSIEYLMAKWGLQCTQLLDAADFLPASKLSALSNSVELIEIRSQD